MDDFINQSDQRQPNGVCDECFEKNRVAHKVEDLHLIGVYCAHTKTGAIRGEQDHLAGDWKINHPAEEPAFWYGLRQAARLMRGEITQFQQAREMMAFGKTQRRKITTA